MQYNQNDDWRNLLDDAGKTVQNAIITGNYSGLSRDISIIADKAVSSIGKSIGGQNASNYRQAGTGNTDPGCASTMQDIHGRNQHGAYQEYEPNPEWQSTKTSEYINKINTERRTAASQIAQRPRTISQVPALYEKLSVQKAFSIGGMVIGYSFGGIMAFILLIFLLFSAFSDKAAGMLIIPGLFMAVGFAGGWSSGRAYGLIKRFEKYVSLLGERTYAEIASLSSPAGRSADAVRKDLKKMISRHWFHQGHISADGGTLIVSDATYEQYLVTCRQQKELETKKQQEKAESEKLSPEVREMMEQGEAYIHDIHQCNDDIPGEEISAKIDRMENSVRRIFTRVREHPEHIDELRRMMSYYLPTTVKLLRAYADMDRQGVAGENIENSKKEIESTIDTLNEAFDKLFDSMFEDSSLDISTDATVMKNMLAQEGLTGHNFSSTNVMGSDNSAKN